MGPGQHLKFMTDWEMYKLWDEGLLPGVTFVQRHGDEVYELANPFVRQAARGVTKAETGALTLEKFGTEALIYGVRNGPRHLRHGLGFDRARRNLE